MGHRALGPFRRGEQAGYGAAAGTQDPGRLVPGAGHVFEGADGAPIVTRSAEFLAERLR